MYRTLTVVFVLVAPTVSVAQDTELLRQEAMTLRHEVRTAGVQRAIVGTQRAVLVAMSSSSTDAAADFAREAGQCGVELARVVGYGKLVADAVQDNVVVLDDRRNANTTDVSALVLPYDAYTAGTTVPDEAFMVLKARRAMSVQRELLRLGGRCTLADDEVPAADRVPHKLMQATVDMAIRRPAAFAMNP